MYRRYAIYYTPPPGALAEFGADWLGWDVASGTPRAVAAEREDIVARPRKYGFHATIKPPFRPTADVGALQADVAALTARLAPVTLEALIVRPLGRFVALVPAGDVTALNAMAAEAVRALDAHRAPAPAEELERRRAAGLTPAQEANLIRWGYPYVMEEFRFHMTLSRALDDPAPVRAEAEVQLTGIIGSPHVIDSLTLVGEGADGMFREVHRYALTG
ncbi:DUF1045 domain-containing protein [Pontivivens ytuae]|uniref:DUF1045 domain-containing protein n=1 Tax=Pontivivens ytuae TaxID=2789856 RepID=A0A7S9LNY1_9RHOB|nr:DUF1045 domain-containing protein [Pontivivens ytuae]QPH52589.1 DUF1045 domain-containing protein [Pontivivens ytuae]